MNPYAAVIAAVIPFIIRFLAEKFNVSEPKQSNIFNDIVNALKNTKESAKDPKEQKEKLETLATMFGDMLSQTAVDEAVDKKLVKQIIFRVQNLQRKQKEAINVKDKSSLNSQIDALLELLAERNK